MDRMERPKIIKEVDLIYWFPEELKYISDLNEHIDWLEVLIKEQMRVLNDAFGVAIKKNIYDNLKK